MSLNDSSAIILIVGALAVIAFVIHGLWFSGKSTNRRLNKDSEADQVLENTGGLGKVRIVSSSASLKETAKEVQNGSFSYTDTGADGLKTDTATEQVNVQEKKSFSGQMHIKPAESYEINVQSENTRPFSGVKLEELFNEWGFMRTRNGLYVCPEAVGKDLSQVNVVFRVCSLKKPFIFPENMKDFETSSLALYMKLPEIGKAEGYYNCMWNAALEIASRLGGRLTDINGHELGAKRVEDILSLLRSYDEASGAVKQIY